MLLINSRVATTTAIAARRCKNWFATVNFEIGRALPSPVDAPVAPIVTIAARAPIGILVRLLSATRR
jgi:hypothetical protein